MSISSTTSRSVRATGNNSATSFSYPFKIIDATDLQVTLTLIATGVQTTLVYLTDYTVTGVGAAGGGSVVLTDNNQVWLDATLNGLLNTYYLDIRRVRPITQPFDFRNQGEFYPESHEDAFDHVVMVAQDHEDQLERALKAPTSDGTAANLTLPTAAQRASMFLAFDASGLPIASVGSATITSPLMATLLANTTTAQARATLGFPVTPSKVLATDAAGVPVTSTVSAVELLHVSSLGAGLVLNANLVIDQAGNNLILRLVTLAGADPSPADPVTVVFRSSSITTGTYVVRNITSALILVVSDTAQTFGHLAATAENLYVYFLDNAGAVELAASTSNTFDTLALNSTTIISGAASRTTLYSGIARSNKAIAPFAKLTSTQVTPGSWVTPISSVALLPPGSGTSNNVTKPSQGGTGVANNDSATTARVGNFPLTTTLTAATNVTFPVSGTLVTADQAAAQNFLINGNFDLWQRGTSFVSPGDTAYLADRFAWNNSSTAVATISRSADVPTLTQSGFQSTYSILTHCSTLAAGLVGASVNLVQYVEGYQWAQLKNRVVTLTFWVKATKTGTYCIAFQNGSGDRSYVVEYTVNATATWEKKTITATMNPVGGTDDFTNARGMKVMFTIAAGATYQATAGSWQSGDFRATSNQVNGVDSTSNDFRIAQTMLTLGASVSPFSRAGGNYGQEVALCQRYFEKSYDVNVDPGTAATSIGATLWLSSRSFNAEQVVDRYKVNKRNTATMAVSIYSTTTGTVSKVRDTSAAADVSASATSKGQTGHSVTFTGNDGAVLAWHWTADSEL